MNKEFFMREAIADAEKHKHHFGAVVVKGGRVISFSHTWIELSWRSMNLSLSLHIYIEPLDTALERLICNIKNNTTTDMIKNW